MIFPHFPGHLESEVRMPMVATGNGAIDVMSKLLQDRILMLNGQARLGRGREGNRNTRKIYSYNRKSGF